MKKVSLKVISFILSAAVVIIAAVPCISAADGVTSEKLSEYIDGILNFKQAQCGAASVQELIDGALTQQAGSTAEWYVLAIRQYRSGYNYSKYSAALQRYVSDNDASIASTRERYALMFVATGYPSDYITKTINEDIGKLGIMSWVFGLHLLNNGYTSSQYSAAAVVNKLLSLRLSDGGWAVSGSSSDPDVTSMTIQALAPYYNSDSAVKQTIDAALSLLSSSQNSDGDFVSYGAANPESTAQVITALSALNINPFTDSRFIKDGKTLLDGLLKYQLPDGSFCHKIGDGYNHTATFQAMYSLVAAYRQSKSLGSLYVFPVSERPVAPAETSTTKAPTTTAKSVILTPNAATTASTTATTTKASTTATTVPTTTKPSVTAVTASSATTAAATTQKSAENTTSTTTKAATVSSESLSSTLTETTSASDDSTTEILDSETQSDSVLVFADEAVQSESAAETQTGEALDVAADNVKEKLGIKKWAVIAIWLAAVIACAVLWACGKRNKTYFIAVLIVGAVLTGIMLTTDISSTDEYYASQNVTGENTITVTMSISCTMLTGKADSDSIPSDGVILAQTAFTLEENATAFELLVLAARENEIQIENAAQTGDTYSTAYISAIANIYEFDYGELSGWMYRVNNEFPSVGCGEYELKDGDSVEWLYTCNLGDDLK